MAPTRQERKERVTGERKRQILDAALAVFSDKGYAEATVPDIAEAAGIAVGSIYNYYESKRDLLVSVIESEIGAAVLGAMPPHLLEAGDYVATLEYLIRDRLDVAFKGANRLMPLMAEIQRDEELRRLYTMQVVAPGTRFVQEHLRLGAARGELREVNTDVVARVLIAIFIGLTILYRLEGEEGPLSRVSRSQLADEVASLILKGIRQVNSEDQGGLE